jgi:hypothetical protein
MSLKGGWDMAKKKPDWMKIRIEYETTKTSYRKLAEKYSVPFPTLRDRAGREGWKESADIKRNEIVTKTVTKSSQKLSERISDKKSNKIVAALDIESEAISLLNATILKTLQDERQFNRHLVQMKEITSSKTNNSKDAPGCSDYSERQWVEEQQFELVDSKRLKDIASALNIVSALRRELEGILPEPVKQKLEIEREKLEMEKGKSKVDEVDGVQIIIEGDAEEWSK